VPRCRLFETSVGKGLKCLLLLLSIFSNYSRHFFGSEVLNYRFYCDKGKRLIVTVYIHGHVIVYSGHDRVTLTGNNVRLMEENILALKDLLLMILILNNDQNKSIKMINIVCLVFILVQTHV
jgi:hypothetical protein